MSAQLMQGYLAMPLILNVFINPFGLFSTVQKANYHQHKNNIYIYIYVYSFKLIQT